MLDDVTALLRERGLPVPAARPKAGRPAKGTDRSYVLPEGPVAVAAPGETYWNAESIVAVLRVWEAALPAGAEPTLSRYRSDQRDHPEWPAPETVRDHGPWEMLRDEAVRRNTLVARGQPDDFPALPARANRGEVARQRARELHIKHEPGHRKRADGARIQVSDLIAAGLLTPGEHLTGRFRGTDHVAVVEADGQLHVLGKGRAASPSQAEKLASNHPKNGWRFWWVQRDGQRRRLEAVRDELLRAAPDEPGRGR